MSSTCPGDAYFVCVFYTGSLLGMLCFILHSVTECNLIPIHFVILFV